MSLPFPRALLVLSLTMVFPALLRGQEIDASLLQKKTGEWIETRRILSQEAAAWQSEKATLGDLNAIRTKEASQLDEFIQAAGARVAELAKQKDTSAGERDSLRKWRIDFEAAFVKLESEAKTLVPRFPISLRDKVGDAVQRIEEGEPDRPLQDRVRDVLLVLQAAKEFDDSFTVATEVREIEGKPVEVRILYLGLSQAWYVDPTGIHGGYGLPSAEGWVWTEDRAIAPAVRDAIAIQTGEATAAFVTLPFVPLSSAAPK